MFCLSITGLTEASYIIFKYWSEGSRYFVLWLFNSTLVREYTLVDIPYIFEENVYSVIVGCSILLMYLVGLFKSSVHVFVLSVSKRGILNSPTVILDFFLSSFLS